MCAARSLTFSLACDQGLGVRTFKDPRLRGTLSRAESTPLRVECGCGVPPPRRPYPASPPRTATTDDSSGQPFAVRPFAGPPFWLSCGYAVRRGRRGVRCCWPLLVLGAARMVMRDAPLGVVFWARRRAPPLRSLALAEVQRSGDERAQLEVAFCVYIVPRERGCPALPEGGGRRFPP